MKLIDGWRAELNRLWSIRMALLSAALTLGNEIFSALAGVTTSTWVNVASAGFAIGAIVARVMKQGVKGLEDDSGQA